MICLLAGSNVVPLMASAITLVWSHSVERTRWEEDWRVGPKGLELVEARVQGSGAGMEPSKEARLVDGMWRWRPDLPALQEVVLRRSGATADWRVCIADQCRPMDQYVPSQADPVLIRACKD